MITYRTGSIFDSTADVLVCPVNCVGVMGKGLALEFKKRFPNESDGYRVACSIGMINAGLVLAERSIRFAATKDHWRNPSKIEWVERCIIALTDDTSAGRSVALPRLGCGCGGLDWADVEPLILKHLGDLPVTVEVWNYE